MNHHRVSPSKPRNKGRSTASEDYVCRIRHCSQHRTTMPIAKLPQELLEEIGSAIACLDFPGPPTSLLQFTSIDRTVHTSLGPETNPFLYAKLFACNFDLRPIQLRYGSRTIPETSLLRELIERTRVLKTIKAQAALELSTFAGLGAEEKCAILRSAYIMMLENEHKNLCQISDYASMSKWLELYWLDKHQTSSAASTASGGWPSENREARYAMWTTWFMIQNGTQNHSENVQRPMFLHQIAFLIPSPM